MSVRVTAAEVKDIIDTDLASTIIDTFITAANLTVTEYLGASTELSSDQLKEIERWLTAHLIACTRERQVKSEDTGQASVTYTGNTAMGLDATLYGQQVKVLDTTGTLAAKVGKKAASIYAVTSFAEDDEEEEG